MVLSLSKNAVLFIFQNNVSKSGFSLRLQIMIASNLVEMRIVYVRIQIYNVECYLGVVEIHASTG
jgi:hypothetical protein